MKIIAHRVCPFVIQNNWMHIHGMEDRFGWGNGYVALLPNHPCYGLDNTEMSKFAFLDPHGGITFSGFMSKNFHANIDPKYHIPYNEKLWVLGFDTMHNAGESTKWPDENSVLEEIKRFQIEMENIDDLHPTAHVDDLKIFREFVIDVVVDFDEDGKIQIMHP